MSAGSTETVQETAERLLGHALPAGLADDAAIKRHVVAELLNDREEHGPAFYDGSLARLSRRRRSPRQDLPLPAKAALRERLAPAAGSGGCALMGTSKLTTDLAGAIAAEAEAKAAAEQLQGTMEAAKRTPEDARGERARMIAAVSLGGSITDAAGLARVIAEAEESLSIYEAAGVAAQQRIDDAAAAVDAALLAIAKERAAAVQREYRDAEQASIEAIAHRERCFRRMQSADGIVLGGSAETVKRDAVPAQFLSAEDLERRRQRAREHLRSVFAAELEHARAA